MSYIIALLGLSALCVVWVIFQGWLAKTDKDYKGYKAGCGGCSRSCGEPQTEHKDSVQLIDASSLLKDDQR